MKSIVTKTLVALVAALSLSFAILVAVHSTKSMKSTTDTFRENAVIHTELIASQINTGTRLKREAMITPQIDAVLASEGLDVAGLRVSHVEGIEVLRRIAEGQPETALEGLADPAFADQPVIVETADAILVSVPIILGTGDAMQQVGELSVVWDKSKIKARVATTIYFDILLMSVALLIVCGLTFLIMRRLLSLPLTKSISALERLADGDADVEVPNGNSSEIEAISKALRAFRAGLLERNALASEQLREQAALEENNSANERLIKELSVVTSRAARGDLTARMDATAMSGPGVVVATEVNAMLEEIAASIEAVISMLHQLAETDLRSHMHGDFNGVFAELQADANTTISTLAELVQGLNTSCASARDRASMVVNEASDLARRVEGQAVSLQETTSTVEEISTVVSQNAERLREAEEKVQAAEREVAQGRGMIGQANHAMAGIEESSSKITSIISVIDSISFQTNLLALNAAVEAARAGESGKGFAVVASEVRTLAQRSAEAARDITGLITESTASVSSGVDLVAQTAESLETIGGVIGDLLARISDITAAGSEQALAVSEISQSIAKLDAATQANAGSAERAASEMNSLREEIGGLEQMVAGFKLPPAIEDKRDAA